MQIDGQTFLITGGSSGLGAACLRRLYQSGASIVVADLQEPGEELTDMLGNRGRFIATDVTDEDSVRQAVGAARGLAGPLRGVINCAGVIHGERLLGKQGPFDLAAFRRVVEVNLVGTFNVVRLAAEAISEAEPFEDGQRGVIINTSSVAAFEGQVGQAAYAASKGGVASLTVPLMRELAPFGIRVMSIAPGVFETPMMQQIPETIRESLQKQIPFPSRFGRPEEYAALAEHIIANPMLNGETIRLDGGLRMAAR